MKPGDMVSLSSDPIYVGIILETRASGWYHDSQGQVSVEQHRVLWNKAPFGIHKIDWVLEDLLKVVE